MIIFLVADGDSDISFYFFLLFSKLFVQYLTAEKQIHFFVYLQIILCRINVLINY